MNKVKNVMVMLFLLVTVISCKKEAVVQIPFEIKTSEVTEVEWETATSGGEILTDGGSIVSFRGVVWDTKNSPKADLETKTNDGRGLGSFKTKIVGLKPNTQYYLRAYAINSKDTVYGNEISFKTSSWTPKDIKNTFDWWESNSGILQRSGSVEKWAGANGNVLLPNSIYGLASYKTKDISWGNQPSVELNPRSYKMDCGYISTISKQETDKTIILVAKLNDFYPERTPIMTLGIPEYLKFGLWGLPSGIYLMYEDDGPVIQYGSTFKKNNYQFIRVSYDRKNGGISYYISNELNLKNKIYTSKTPSGKNFTKGYFGLGYGKAHGYTPNMSVVEVLQVDAIPSDQELATYEKYLKYKYKF